MSNQHIGTPYDDSRGTIREIMVNYSPMTHRVIYNTIKAMPHVDFILFDGLDSDEIGGLIDEKRSSADWLPSELLSTLDKVRNRPEIFDSYEPLIQRKNSLELNYKTFSPEYVQMKAFLELAALHHHKINRDNFDSEKYDARKISDEFGDRVELVKAGHIISQWSRDSVIALYDGEDRIIIPSNVGVSGDVMAQTDMGYDKIANNPVWKKRGYRTGESLNVKTIVGGQVLADSKNTFVGVNSYEESQINDGNEKCEADVKRISEEKELVILKDPNLYYHVDVLIMPMGEDTLYISDPAATLERLKKHKVKVGKDIEDMRECMKLTKRLKERAELLGYRTKPLPFWINTYDNAKTMFTYCNTLQEDGKVYAPRLSANNNQKTSKIGKILDDWFLNEMSKEAEVIQIGGFGDSFNSWKDAGLRCLNNVVWREE